MRSESNFLRLSALCFSILPAAVFGALVSGQTTPGTAPDTALADTVPFTRQMIADLVHVSGDAKEYKKHIGAAVIAGVKIYRWEESNTHDVYFFERDKQLYGEYRDETFANGHIDQRTEYYLLNWQTRGKPQDEGVDLPFTRKTEHFIWDKDVCTGSTVEWQHTWRAKAGGELIKSTPAKAFKMVRAPVTVEIPVELMSTKDAIYSIIATRNAADFERDFRNVDKKGDTVGMVAVLDGGILNGASMKVQDGKASATLEWPVGAPAFRLELSEAVRNPPMYQAAYTARTIATMELRAPPADGKPILFKP